MIIPNCYTPPIFQLIVVSIQLYYSEKQEKYYVVLVEDSSGVFQYSNSQAQETCKSSTFLSMSYLKKAREFNCIDCYYLSVLWAFNF
jgi:hypothetical protein